MSKLRQNNPILYLFIGMPDEQAMNRVRVIQQRRVDTNGIGYVSVFDGDGMSEINERIQREQMRFFRTMYITAGELKIVYVVNADSKTALELSGLKNNIEEQLHTLYPGGIVTEIFLLLDDISSIDSKTKINRAKVLNLLSELQADTSMVYILSNVNSKKLYVADSYDRMLHSIALMCVMKDYVSLKTGEQIYKWYNERYFKDDCYRHGGQFMTVGYLSIKKPIEILKKLFLIELLTFRMVEKPAAINFLWLPKAISEQSWNYLKENIHGLAIDSSVDRQSLGNFTNKQALKKLFGSRLDEFFKLNFHDEHIIDGITPVKNYLQACCKDTKKGFYYVLSICAPDGALRRHIVVRLQAAENELRELSAKDADWQSKNCVPNVKRGLALGLVNLPRMPEYIYEMAVNYLEPKFKRLQPSIERARLKEALAFIEGLFAEFDRNRQEITEYIKVLEAQADSIQETNKDLFFKSDNINGYYIELLRDFIKSDAQYDELYGKLWRCFNKSGFSLYVAELEKYINDVIIKQDVFQRSVVSDLQGLYNSGTNDFRHIYDNIWEWIVNNRHYNVMLKAGETNLYNEINVFIDVNSQMASKLNISREKINFFYEDYDESIDVLYHAGAFSKEELYYEEFYEK